MYTSLFELIPEPTEGNCPDCGGSGCEVCNWSGYNPNT